MFNELFSLLNIFKAWSKFQLGKSRKKDVVSFEYHIEDNIMVLHENILKYEYKHKEYKHFTIFDNKKRDIFKADVQDRIVHQIIYDYLLSIYEPIFISDSYSSRRNKGHHKAVSTLKYFIKLSSSGNRKQCFVLKCDIKKYFDNVDHQILLTFIKEKVKCQKIFSIIEEIITSYNKKDINGQILKGKGIPLGNITSQIFANIYLHNFDMYIKKELRYRYYIRYNDDLAIVSNNKIELEELRYKIIDYLAKNHKLTIPIEKTSIRKIAWGIDFLGYIILPNAVILRDKTKNKMYKNMAKNNIISYLGLLKHCNSYNLKRKVISKIFDKEIGGVIQEDDLYN